MAQHLWLALPDKDMWSYYELLWISPIVFGDHLVIILQVPLVDKSFVMTMSNVHNLAILPMLHPTLWKTFHFSLESEYLALSSNVAYTIIPSECAMQTSVFTEGHVLIWYCIISHWKGFIVFYTLFVNGINPKTCHLMPLVPALLPCDASWIISGLILFI